MTAPTRAHFRQFIRETVRWGDMDALGHVNNARFFTYDESGRIAYFEPWKELDPGFWDAHGLILAHIGCDFLAQLRYPAQLDIGTRIARLGKSSLHTESAMFEGERAVAVVRGVVVWFDYRAQRPLPLPPRLREWIRAREALAPEE
ncbi:MAG: acyl-CoA thioesterase [Nevskia sp.]|nr:acyl-CoA thioesterase [Nevskia sp.]